MRDVLLPFSGE